MMPANSSCSKSGMTQLPLTLYLPGMLKCLVILLILSGCKKGALSGSAQRTGLCSFSMVSAI
uniref:Uncharacterized protein n=1 Tax=Anguilla anguilla TaxID=7936 RepID=A0A0E9WDH4_ANGAN